MPLGRQVSISGSSLAHGASVSMLVLPQEGPNASNQNRFKLEQAVVLLASNDPILDRLVAVGGSTFSPSNCFFNL